MMHKYSHEKSVLFDSSVRGGVLMFFTHNCYYQTWKTSLTKMRYYMGRYCACGQKKYDGWECKCNWDGWFACFNNKDIPDYVPIKEFPNKEGTYLVRTFDEGDNSEEESEYVLTPKNWGEYNNEAISRWKIAYNDNYLGYRGVYAWKENS